MPKYLIETDGGKYLIETADTSGGDSLTGGMPIPDATGQARTSLSPDQTRARALESMQLDNPYNFVDNGGGSFLDSAKEAFTGAIKGLVHVPTFDETAGPVADQSKDLPAATVGRVTDQTLAGNYGGAAGTVLGTGAGIAGPALAMEGLNQGARAVRNVAAKIPPVGFQTQLDPAEAAAVQYGRDNGVQMRTSVQTGSKLAADAETVLAHTPRAAGVAESARAAERSTLAAAGEREVANLAPDATGPVPQPLDVGEAIHKTAIENEQKHSLAADDAYNVLRSIENQPQFKATLQTGTKLVDGGLDENGNPTQKRVPVMEDVQLPVDYRGLKAAVKPLLADVLRPMSIAQEQSSTGIKAMRNIVDSPDFVPASVADQDLGALKGIMRESPQSRSVAQAKFAADILSKQVDAAVERAGPDAVAALKQGRDSTVNKYAAQDFQKQLGFTDVGTSRATPGSAVDLVNNLTRPGDRSIDLLRAVKENTPEHLPALAQATVQGLIEQGSRDAGMDAPKATLRKVLNMGDQTKQILFGDRAQAIENWFTLNKRLADDANPSGSGKVLAALKLGGLVISSPLTGVPILVGAKPLARMLFEPTATRNLIAAMKTPASSPGAGLLARDILKAAGPDGVTPVSAGTQGPMAAGAASVPPSSGGPSSGVSGAGVPGTVAAAGDRGAAAGGSGGTLRSNGTSVVIPGEPGPGYQAAYKLRELADVQPSHSGQTFLANPKYGISNDRNYSNAVNQGKVVNWSSRAMFNPKQVLSDIDDATGGPPVVDSAGNVLGGNGRAMILQRVHATNPAGAAAYKALLTEKAPQFGIDPADVGKMKQPVLVREVPDSEFSAARTKQTAVTDFNKKGTAALTPEEQAIADSKRVSPATLESTLR